MDGKTPDSEKPVSISSHALIPSMPVAFEHDPRGNGAKRKPEGTVTNSAPEEQVS